MSSRSTQIIGGAQRQRAFVEGAPLNALRTTNADTIEFGASSGLSLWANHTDLEVAVSGNVEILIQTGANAVNILFSVSISDLSHVWLYEDSTFSAAGTSIPCHSRQRTSPTTSTATVTHTPTITDNGTRLLDAFFPGGIRGAAGPPLGGTSFWALKANAVYLLRIDNISATTTAMTVGVDIVDPGAS